MKAKYVVVATTDNPALKGVGKMSKWVIFIVIAAITAMITV